MKIARLLPAFFMAAMLCGCPDTKLPQAPPSVPQPKAANASFPVIIEVANPEFSV